MFFLWFLVGIFLAFFVPGDLFIKKLCLPAFPRVVLAFGLGMVLWALQGFVLGFAGLRVLTYLYVLLCAGFWLKSNLRDRHSFRAVSRLSFDPITAAIIIVGVLFQLSAVWFLGVTQDGGLFFCCRGVPDDIYHLALTNQLVAHFPPQEPGMASVLIKNYHYLASLTMADLIRVFQLPLISTVYRYFSVFISVLLGLTLVATAKILELNKKVTRLWLFFVYFHGDVLYLLLLLRGKGLNFDVTIFDDATKLLAGPPRSFSILLLFIGIALFLIWIKRRNFLSGILAVIVFGSLVGFKVYTGIFALIGLVFVSFYHFSKRDWKMLIPPILAAVISLLIYIPVNGVGGGFSWNGFYRFDNFISQPIFGMANLELMRLAGAQYLVIPFAVAYFVFLYGASLSAFIQNRKSLALLPDELHIFLLPTIGITAILGTFFVQSVGGLNSVQFLITLYFVLPLYCALAVQRFPKFFLAIVLLFAFGRPAYEAWGNGQMILNKQGYFISADELAGLNYLRTFTAKNAVVAIPADLARQEVSLHVSFLADRPLYVAGYTGVLQDHQVVGAKDRLERPDFSQADYIYIPRRYSFPVSGQTVFENQGVKILRVLKTLGTVK